MYTVYTYKGQNQKKGTHHLSHWSYLAHNQLPVIQYTCCCPLTSLPNSQAIAQYNSRVKTDDSVRKVTSFSNQSVRSCPPPISTNSNLHFSGWLYLESYKTIWPETWQIFPLKYSLCSVNTKNNIRHTRRLQSIYTHNAPWQIYCGFLPSGAPTELKQTLWGGDTSLCDSSLMLLSI